MPTQDFAATEGPNQRAPFAGYPSTPLRVFGDRGLLIPFRLSFDASDDLLIKQATKYVFAEMVAGPALRLHIPPCPARNVMVHVTGQVGMTLGAVTRTTAPSGYIDIALDPAETEGELTGFVYIVTGFGKTTAAVRSASHYTPRSAAISSHKMSEVGSPFRELFVAPYSFAVDASADPDPDTFYGPRAFAVDHPDVGEYELPERFAEAILVASAGDTFLRTTQGSAVVLSTDDELAATDPTDEDQITLLAFVPVMAEDKNININSPDQVRSPSVPAPPGGEGNVRCAVRDGILVPFMLRVTAGALVEGSSFLPDGARASIASGTLRLEVGTFSPDRFWGSAVQLEDGTSLPLTVVDENDGVVSLAPAANGVVTGWILASATKQR